MKEVNLTTEQIEELFAFVRSKYVRWVDVQYEIVDHLATGIEERMSTDENMTFKTALHKEYSKFPITGFAKLVEAKEKAMGSYWTKKFFSFMLSYMKLPKIILAVLLFFVFYTLIINFSKNGFYIIYASILITSIGGMYLRRKNGIAQFSPEMHKYLVTSTFAGLNGAAGMSFLMSPLYCLENLIESDMNLGFYQIILMSIFFTFIHLWNHATVYVFPEMLEEELHKKYGHLKVKFA